MNLTKKIWHDENSEPPKNYLWAKGGKLFKNIEGQWKEVSKKDSGNVSIDDVVKFVLQTGSDEPLFNTYEEIPDLKDIDVSTFTDGVYKGTAEEAEALSTANENLEVSTALSTSSYGIYNVSVRPEYRPFTIEALGEGNISWALDNLTVQYSKNGGEWTTMDAETTVAVVAGDSLAFKGENASYSGLQLASTGNFSVKGNIMSLIAGDNFGDATTVGNNAFMAFFQDCTSLTSASKLALPATTLGDACYLGMFGGCSNLVEGPKVLPALTLTNQCYSNMFQNCTSLVAAPKILATTIGNSSCQYMFGGCSSLVNTPVLPAETLDYNCYYHMFDGCTSLTTAPELPATTLKNMCYLGMFSGCTSLVNVPAELPATTLIGSCYERMFEGCTSLTTAPVLPATTILGYCYYAMFSGCSSLNYVKAMFTTTPTSGGHSGEWLKDVSATGTFVKNSEASWDDRGDYAVPTGWTIEVAS